eukprot:1442202-Prymnesium_polylepis.1
MVRRKAVLERYAVSASYFTLGNASQAVCDLFRRHVIETGSTQLCLFGAAEFLCRARQAIDHSTMSLSNAVLCVRSGAVGNMIYETETESKIDGPFVLTSDATAHAKQVLVKMYPSKIGRIIRYTESSGSSCGRTELFKGITRRGYHSQEEQ